MKTVTFTEFRKHPSGLFSDVEGGENLLVLRHGKLIAEIVPVSSTPETAPSWKRRGLRLTAKGAALSTAIIEERRGVKTFFDLSAFAKRYESSGNRHVDAAPAFERPSDQGGKIGENRGDDKQ